MGSRIFPILLFAIGVLLVSPQWYARDPVLIDDASDYFISRMSYADLFYEELVENERTWPLRVMSRKVLFDLFGLNMTWHYIGYSVLLGAILVLFYRVLILLGVRTVMAFTGALVFAVSPPVIANFYRLGTGEPLQALLFLLFVFLSLKGRLSGAVTVAVSSLLFKESSLFLTGVFSVYFMIKKIYIHGAILGVATAIFAAVVAFKLQRGGEYIVRAMGGGISQPVQNAGVLFSYPVPFILLAAAIGITGMLLAVYRARIPHYGILLGFIASVLPTSFVWRFNQEYYLLPIYMVSIIAFLSVSSLWTSYTRRENRMARLYFVLIVYFVLTLSVRRSVAIAAHWHASALSDGALVSYLLGADFRKTNMYAFEEGYEKNHKIWLYASKFQKDDIFFVPDTDRWIAGVSSPDARSEILRKARGQYVSDEAHTIGIFPVHMRFVCDGNSQMLCRDSLFVNQQCGYTVCERNIDKGM